MKEGSAMVSRRDWKGAFVEKEWMLDITVQESHRAPPICKGLSLFCRVMEYTTLDLIPLLSLAEVVD